jgi:hypothetical protein
MLLFLLGCGGGQDECIKDYELSDKTKITDESKIPSGTWGDKRCPKCGEKLEHIVIDPDDPNMVDEPWRYGYYCQKHNEFWIADMPGMTVNWYGPFKGKPCKGEKL